MEVDCSGVTRSHVLRGKVEMQSLVGGRPDGRPVQLVANQWARVEARPSGGGPVIRGDGPGDAAQFVRQMPRQTRRRLPGRPAAVANSKRHCRSCAALRGADGVLRVSYSITDLGTFGGPVSLANAVNAAGQVVGEAMDSGGVGHAFLYTGGRMEKLSPPGGGQSTAVAINSAGQVAGNYDGDHRAFLYSGDVVKDLGTLGGSTASAAAINDAGQVVGASENRNGVTRAFIYSAGEGMKTCALGGAKARSWARGINADGLVAGYSETDAGDTHAFVYSRDQGMRDIGASLAGHNSWAFHVNAAGQVVGYFLRGDNVVHVFVYSRSQGVKEVGTFSHLGAADILLDINNKGDVVGQASWDAGGVELFRFTDGKRVFQPPQPGKAAKAPGNWDPYVHHGH